MKYLILFNSHIPRISATEALIGLELEQLLAILLTQQQSIVKYKNVVSLTTYVFVIKSNFIEMHSLAKDKG